MLGGNADMKVEEEEEVTDKVIKGRREEVGGVRGSLVINAR